MSIYIPGAKKVNSIFASVPKDSYDVDMYGESQQDGEPTPDAPTEVESVEVSEIKSVGKQLVDVNKTVINYKIPNSLPPGTYTLSFKTTPSIGGGFRMSNSTDTSTNSVRKLGVANSNGYIAITVTTDFVTNYINVSSDNSVASEIMLNEGSEALPYEPYKESKVTLSTPIILRGIGNVKDVLCKQDGVYGVLRCVKEIDLSTITSWTKGYGFTNTYCLYNSSILSDAVKISGYNQKANIMCNRLIVDTASNITTKEVNAVGQGEKTLYVSFVGISTSSDLISYLSQNKTYVYCKFETPLFEPLPDVDNEQLENIKIYTNTSTDSEIEPIMEIEHSKVWETKKIVSVWTNKDGVATKVFDSVSEITAFKGMVILSGNDLSYKLPIEIPLNSELIESPTGSGGIISSVAFGYTSTLLTLTDKAIKKYKYIDVGLVTNSVTTVCNYRNNSTFEMVSRTVKPNVHVQGEVVDGKIKISEKTITIIAEPPTVEGFTYVNTLQPQISGVAVSKVVLYS